MSLASSMNPDSMNVSDIAKFTGSTAHGFSMYMQNWKKYVEFKNVASIILSDKDEHGVKFSESLKQVTGRDLFFLTGTRSRV